ncbi:ABC transporter permease [bacterium]|nr:ABC transporter permease [bacterium]
MSKNKIQPPRFLRNLFRLLSLDSISNQSFIGDCEELYSIIQEQNGSSAANVWYFTQIIKSLPAIFWKQITSTGQLTIHYTQFTLRYLRKHVTLSGIKLASLTIGLICVILFYFNWQYETGFDRFHENFDHIYRLDTETEDMYLTYTPFPMAELMKEHAPFIKSVSCLYSLSRPTLKSRNAVTEVIIAATDKDFFNIFTLEMLEGDIETIFNSKNTVILSKSKALELFQNQNPLGQELELSLSYKNTIEIKKITVGGIYKDLPEQSTLDVEALLSWKSLTQFEDPKKAWDFMARTYILLSDDAQPAILKKIINNQFKTEKPEKIYGGLAKSREIHLTPFSRIHSNTPGLKTYLSIFAAITFFVIMLSCINYINLTTNQALERTKEIGIKKVNGAERFHLSTQFILESIITAMLALLISFILFMAMLPALNGILGKNITLMSHFTPHNIVFLLIITLIIGIISGAYPALYLSSIKPQNLFYQSRVSHTSRSTIKRVLVTFQFLILTILLTSALIAKKQLMYINNADLGMNPENVIIINTNHDIFRRSDTGLKPLKDALQSHTDIISISNSWQLPTKMSPHLPVDKSNTSDIERIQFASLIASKGLLETYGITLKSGRFFEEYIKSEISTVVVNETAVKQLGLTNPLGAKITSWGGCHQQFKMESIIIGVIKDYHSKSLHHFIPPLIIEQGSDWGTYLAVRTAPGKHDYALNYIHKKWQELYPNITLKHELLNDIIKKEYHSENRLVKLSQTFSLLSVLIALLGLIGLITFHTDRRKKEIGIRKVLGAESRNLYWLLIREFIKPVLWANAIGLPIAWLIIQEWMQQFAYRTSTPLSLYIFAGFMTIIIAVFTVSMQIMRAIRTNPTHYLRSE